MGRRLFFGELLFVVDSVFVDFLLLGRGPTKAQTLTTPAYLDFVDFVLSVFGSSTFFCELFLVFVSFAWWAQHPGGT